MGFRNAEKLRVSEKELAPILAAIDGATGRVESGKLADSE